MELEIRVEQLQSDVIEIRQDLERHSKFILGNGDPKQGLMWVVADVSRLLATQSEMLTTQGKALEQHRIDGHYNRQPWYLRMGFDVLKSVVIWATLGIFALAVLGARVSIGHGP